MRNGLRLVLIVCCFCVAAPSAHAGEKDPAKTDDASIATDTIPPLLDDRYRISHYHQNDITLQGGSYLGDFTKSSYVVGGRYLSDLYFTFGGGSMYINRQWKWSSMVGGGMKIYFPSIPWYAMTIDVESYFHPVPGPGGTSFASDIDFVLGFSFMFPTRGVPADQKKF